MARFRKIPLEIKAIQWTGDNIEEIWETFGATGIYGPTEVNPDFLLLETPDGFQTPCRLNEWIVPNSKANTFHSVDSKLMAAKYIRLPD
jgi:hypothetical protein